MNKYLVFLLTICTSLNIQANDISLNCPDGTSEVSGNRSHEEQPAVLKGCVDVGGELHGPTVVTVNNVVVDRCFYIHGVMHGTCTAWHISGERKHSQQFKNGVLDGEVTGWHKNGSIELKAFHENGKPVGIWKTWDPTGKLLKVIEH